MRNYSSKSDYSDEEIIAILKSNQKREVDGMVAYMLKSFRGIVVSIVPNSSDDWEADLNTVLNDSIIALVEMIQKGLYQPKKGKLSTVFYSIAKNKSLNIIRKRKKDKEREEEYALDYSKDKNAENEGEKKLLREENKQLMVNAIKKLDEKCLNILMDFWLEDGIKLKDIAKELKKSEDAIKQKHRRCLKQLKKLFKGKLEDYL